MLSIFEFINYRKYLAAWIEARGDLSYGQKGKIAVALGVSSSLISQVLKGEKSLTSDQTFELATYMGLTEGESDYLHILVEQDRAGNHRYRERLDRKIKAAQEHSKKIGSRVPRDQELSDKQKSIYYSSWLYTGIRNLSAISENQDSEAIAAALNLDRVVVVRVLRFLIENGLCKEEKGRITYGPASIHVDKESPFVNKHHQNWRIQALQKMELKKDEDLFFTSPMSLSFEAAEEIRRLLPAVIQNIMKIVGPSPSERTACLNIDWFKF